jgi:hypothetical protein
MMRRGVGRGRVGRPGLVGTMARTAVVAGTATAVVGGVSHHQASKAQGKADDQAAVQQQAYDQGAADAAAAQQAAAQQAAAQQQYAAQQAAAAAAAAPAPAAGGITPDVVEQLKQLADLKAQGILTDEEFAAQKAKLLG